MPALEQITQACDSILVVEDDAATRQTLKSVLEQEGHRIEAVGQGAEALVRIEHQSASGSPYALVVADLHLEDTSGLEVVRYARKKCAETQTVVITGQADVHSAVQALREGAQDYLLKPYDLAELKITVAKLLEKRREAIWNAELLAAARRRANELAILNRVGQTVTRSLDLDQVLGLILEQIRDALQVEAGSIALVEEGKLVFKVASGPAAEQVRAFALELGQGIMGCCVADAKPIIVNNVEQDRRHYRQIDAKTHFVTRSILCVPLRATGGCVIGSIEAINRLDGQGFTQNDLDLLQAISVPAAVAVENAMLHRSLAERAQELAAALHELKEADRLKSEFVQNMSHELRTPLTFIKGYVELFQSEMLGPLTEEQASSLDLVAQQSELLQQLVDDIILMQEYKLDATQLGLVSLSDVVQEAVDGFRDDHYGPARVNASLPDESSWIHGNQMHLVKVVANLIDNAVKFDPDQNPVGVSLHDRGELWEVRVMDQGVGIPLPEQDKIFERFYQVDGSTTRRFGGAGLGLSVAKEIVEAHGGSIWVQSSPGEGSTFGVLLPKAKAAVVAPKSSAPKALDIKLKDEGRVHGSRPG